MYNEHNHIQEIRSYYNYEYSLLFIRQIFNCVSYNYIL